MFRNILIGAVELAAMVLIMKSRRSHKMKMAFVIAVTALAMAVTFATGCHRDRAKVVYASAAPATVIVERSEPTTVIVDRPIVRHVVEYEEVAPTYYYRYHSSPIVTFDFGIRAHHHVREYRAPVLRHVPQRHIVSRPAPRGGHGGYGGRRH